LACHVISRCWYSTLAAYMSWLELLLLFWDMPKIIGFITLLPYTHGSVHRAYCKYACDTGHCRRCYSYAETVIATDRWRTTHYWYIRYDGLGDDGAYCEDRRHNLMTFITKGCIVVCGFWTGKWPFVIIRNSNYLICTNRNLLSLKNIFMKHKKNSWVRTESVTALVHVCILQRFDLGSPYLYLYLYVLNKNHS